MESLGLGLIGCGGMAMHLATQAQQIPGTRIAAVCDVDEGRAAAAAEQFGVEACSSFEAVVEREDVRAIIVATPGFLHEAPTVAAARAGKHVFSEKPLALTLESCDRMIEACRKAGVTLMVGQVLRLIGPFHKTAELLKAGAIGNVETMALARTGGPGTFGSGWRARFDQSGGVLMEVNVHELDFMRHVGGDVESVYATSRRVVQGTYDFDDTFHIEMRFKSGAVGHLHASCASAIGTYSMTFEGSQGTLVNGGWGGSIRYAAFGGEPTTVDSATYITEEPYRHELRMFVEAVQTGAEPAMPAWEGRAAVELALAAYRSASSGDIVRLPL